MLYTVSFWNLHLLFVLLHHESFVQRACWFQCFLRHLERLEPILNLRCQKGSTGLLSTKICFIALTAYIPCLIVNFLITFSIPRCPSVLLTCLCWAGVRHLLLTKTSMTSVKSNSWRISWKWLWTATTIWFSVKWQVKLVVLSLGKAFSHVYHSSFRIWRKFMFL